MASDTEPAKSLLPFLQRADELQQHEPLVAYYCRLYAMERGLKIPHPQRTKTTNALLGSLMKQLEKDKKSLKLGPDDHLHLEGFAINVFAKADKQDRAGKADINTAKTFYAASIFLEILNQFGELPADLEQKQKYAVWKAADIRKALKEGRKPVPGPPGGEDDFSISSSTPSGYDLEPSNHTDDTNHGSEPDPSLSYEYEDKMKRQPSVNLSPAPPTFPSNYSTQDYNSPHTTGGSESHSYSQQYHQPTYPEEPLLPPPQQQIPQNSYPSHEIPPSYSYPNFQSYPSFSETALPAASPHYSSYYQGSDPSYSHQPPQSTMNYPSGPSATYSSNITNGNAPDPPPPASPHQPPQPATNYPSVPGATYNSSSAKGNAPEPPPASTQMYHYDSNYQPPPDKIAEAHKAARFAVGALAFDDVSIAVDFLKKSLELLTNPSAGQ